MTLQATADSRYRVRSHWSSYNRYDIDYCGDSCNMPNNLGMGHLPGKLLPYTKPTPARREACSSATPMKATTSPSR